MANKIPGTRLYKLTLWVSCEEASVPQKPITDEFQIRELVEVDDEYKVLASEIERLGVYPLSSASVVLDRPEGKDL